jgi:hypothetical protein
MPQMAAMGRVAVISGRTMRQRALSVKGLEQSRVAMPFPAYRRRRRPS